MAQKLSKMEFFALKKIWKLNCSKIAQKNEFFALKNVEFCPKIANFAEKKVKVFSKIVKNVRKNSNFLKKFQKSAIFGQKMNFFSKKSKNFRNFAIFPKKKKFQKNCIFRKKKKKKNSKKP